MGSDVIPHRHAVAVHLDLQRSRHTPEPNVPRPRPTRRSRTAPDGNTFATTTNPDKRAAWFGSPAGASAASGLPVEPYPGVLDHVMGNGVEAVYGAGVGGGSLVFGSFTPVPRRQDFEHMSRRPPTTRSSPRPTSRARRPGSASRRCPRTSSRTPSTSGPGPG